MSVNHRLSSREHLAEAAALHDEGALGPAVRRLRVAAVEAVAALEEPGGRLVPPRAAARLAEHGIQPAGVRHLLADLHLDCAMQERGADTEFTASRVEQAIVSVQRLTDVATGVPTAAQAQVRAAAAPSSGARPACAEVPPLLVIPQRPGRWLAASRRRRRRDRALGILVPLATVLAVLGAGIVIAFAAPERPHDPRLQVLERTHGVAPRAAPREDVR